MQRRHRPLSTPAAAVLALGLLLALLVAPPGAATTTTSDALAIAKDDDGLSNAQVAIQLSQGTPFESVSTVLIGRDDVFADSLASGVLQADSPLLLVPPQGPVPDAVMDELARLGPSSLILLGGTGAIDTAVEEAFTAAGYAVQRRAGLSRLETAVAIAQTDAAQADTVVLARAFAAEGATDPTQQFADAMAAGGMSAENRWPILLTQSEVLSGSTRQYLADSAVQHVVIMGGTAAISAAVEQELLAQGLTVERLAGNDRFETAIEVAGKRGASSAADVARVTMVEAQDADAWAGGFAAASHSAFFDAPIVLANRETVPAATAGWLQGGAFAGEVSSAGQGRFAVPGDDPSAFPVITCVTPREACETARVALGLPPVATITTTPAEGETVGGGQTIAIQLQGSDVSTITVGGTCVGDPRDIQLSGGQGQVTVTSALPQTSCQLQVSLMLPNGATQTTTRDFLTGAAGLELLTVGVDGTAAGGEEPSVDASGQVVAFISDGALVSDVPAGQRHTYVHRDGAIELLDRRPDGTPAPQGVQFVEGPPDVAAGGGHVAFMANDGDLDGQGAASSDLPIGYVRDLEVGSVMRVTVDLQGDLVDRAAHIQISGDGTVVAYWGRTGNGVEFGIMHHDLTTGQVDAVRLPDGSAFSDGSGIHTPALSADGRWIAFYTDLALLPEDTNEATDAYLYDRQTQTLERASVTDTGAQAQAQSFNSPPGIDVSGDGRFVVFSSDAPNLGSGDSGSGLDMFLRDRQTGTTTLVSRHADGSSGNSARFASISRDGSVVGFASSADLTGSGGSLCGLYTASTAGGPPVRIDPQPLGSPSGGCPFRTGVSDDGRLVADPIPEYDPRDSTGRDVYRSATP